MEPHEVITWAKDEEAKMDQSGILLKRLYERYKGERIRHISKWLESREWNFEHK